MNMKRAILLFGIFFQLTVQSEGSGVSTSTDWSSWVSWGFETGITCTQICAKDSYKLTCDPSAIPPVTSEELSAMLNTFPNSQYTTQDYLLPAPTDTPCPRYSEPNYESWWCPAGSVIDCDKAMTGSFAGQDVFCKCKAGAGGGGGGGGGAADPTSNPTASPSADPTSNPTASPSVEPTSNPVTEPSKSPSVNPTTEPSVLPSAHPNAPSATPKRTKLDKKKAGNKDGAQKTKTPILVNPGKGGKTNNKAPLVPKHSKIPKATGTGRPKGTKQGKLLEE